MNTDNEKPISYKTTLNLPTTDFPIRANPKLEDPLLLDRWEKEALYQKAFLCNKGAEKFILHDGPPYANGPIHLGHAYNKILKDIVTKSRRMMGYHVPVTPGWDCHGLPIELKVSQENPGLERGAVKKACRTYAQGWIEEQKKEFIKLGVLMNWEKPYTTMDPAFEAQTVRAFGKLVKNGYIERKNKTVAWCASCQTTLASAEIEYKDRKDPSLFVRFPLTKDTQKELFPAIAEQISVLIWTTTPWTLPLNRAVLAHPDATYLLLQLGDKKIIVGKQAADALCLRLEKEKIILEEFSGKIFAAKNAAHPFIADRVVPILLDDSVGVDEGTAFVHCAPGCGPIDYEVGVKNKLEIYSPISSQGTYTQEIEPKELFGLTVTQGQGWVITELLKHDVLVHKASLSHSYPHCWRCSNGLIFRATRQWFFNLEKNSIQKKALQALEAISFSPQQGKNFLKATIAHRWEWCLSRQRIWGTPIPALLCNGCESVYSTPEFIEKVAQHIQKEGIEYWDNVPLQDLLTKDSICSSCGIQDFRKELDILDVWFDSGVTHYAVLLNNPELAFPADVYLEGVDQHRGWFQSSLLTSMVLEEEACMKAIMTHGYTTDAKGQKMSKSKGNVVAPFDIIQKIGTDGLRLWSATIGLESDPTVSAALLDNVAEMYRKIRNTCRFLLSVLYDFDSEKDSVDFALLLPIDKRALEQLHELNNTLIEEYKKSNFTAVTHGLADYVSVELSARYFDIIKDRLYVEAPKSILRRSAQTACYAILDTLTRLIAPIMSFTAEQVSDIYQKNKKESMHLQQFIKPITDIQALALDAAWWKSLYEIRSLVLKAIELLREQSIIKQSMEARLVISIDFESKKYEHLTNFIKRLPQGYSFEQFLKEFCIVSHVTLQAHRENLCATAQPEVWLLVTQADGVKCPRCWQWDTAFDKETELCNRCTKIVSV